MPSCSQDALRPAAAARDCGTARSEPPPLGQARAASRARALTRLSSRAIIFCKGVGSSACVRSARARSASGRDGGRARVRWLEPAP
jgi:hypothetical protein